MTNRLNINVCTVALLFGLITGGKLAAPVLRDSKDEAITLPGGQKVEQCRLFAKEDISQTFMCVDLARMPLVLTISSVDNLDDPTPLNEAEKVKYRHTLAQSRGVPSFLRSCRPTESRNDIDEFECVNGHKSLHVEVRNHLLCDLKWVEVMVDGSTMQEGAIRPRDAKSAKLPENDKREPPVDRMDCTDVDDPSCDLEDVRSGDN